MIKNIIYAFAILCFVTNCKGEGEKIIIVYKMKNNKQIEKIVYTNYSKLYSINYSSNGWQINDSTVYSDTNQRCYDCYFLNIPEKYFIKMNKDNFDSFPRNYEYRYSQCEGSQIIRLNDSLGLSYIYFERIESLLRYIKSDFDNKINFNINEFRYKFSINDSVYNTVINSLPPDALLLEFGFKKQDGLIISDYFKFNRGFSAERTYTYKNSILDTVYFEVRNSTENYISTNKEWFVIGNVSDQELSK